MPSDTNVQNAFALIENDKSKTLGLTVGSHQHVQPGQYIPRADAQSPPQLTFATATPSKTYLIVNLDIDAPFPSFGVLGPILHWIQPGVKASTTTSSSSNSGTGTALEATAPFIADYIGPAPPPGSSPHRYIFMLFEQPENLDVAKYAPANGQNLGSWGRVRYDFDAWAEEIGLGPVIAFNYFTSN